MKGFHVFLLVSVAAVLVVSVCLEFWYRWRVRRDLERVRQEFNEAHPGARNVSVEFSRFGIDTGRADGSFFQDLFEGTRYKLGFKSRLDHYYTGGIHSYMAVWITGMGPTNAYPTYTARHAFIWSPTRVRWEARDVELVYCCRAYEGNFLPVTP